MSADFTPSFDEEPSMPATPAGVPSHYPYSTFRTFPRHVARHLIHQVADEPEALHGTSRIQTGSSRIAHIIAAHQGCVTTPLAVSDGIHDMAPGGGR
ncbi:hypothetical protein [Streptomyces sp. NPDC012756]|uniref:hypothetical protein n=1 Tax=Streptomyces sp. NPDC012756 TaxID=3364847 RepID=UPI0036AD52FA